MVPVGDIIPPSLWHTGEGYEYFRCRAGDSDSTLYVHRLLYVAEHGLDELPADWHVHHEIPIPWLNTPENLRAVGLDPTGYDVARLNQMGINAENATAYHRLVY